MKLKHSMQAQKNSVHSCYFTDTAIVWSNTWNKNNREKQK